MLKSLTRVTLAVGILGALGACASPVEIDKRFSALEEKVNEALRDSRSAKIDAATALMIADKK